MKFGRTAILIIRNLPLKVYVFSLVEVTVELIVCSFFVLVWLATFLTAEHLGEQLTAR